MAINELSQIDKAKDIAMDVHSNQKRKGSNKPYFIHPFRVYQSAKQMGLDKESQIVSLLHDVYEDSKNKKRTLEKIKSVFNSTVVKFVLLLSHDKNKTNYNDYVLSLAKKSDIALQVKLLDMIENLKDNPTEKQVNKYYSAIKNLLDNNININSKILSILKKINKSNIYI